jgi:hypothetical protein
MLGILFISSSTEGSEKCAVLYAAPVLISGGSMVRPDGQSEHQLTPRRFSVLFSLSSGFSQMLYGVCWTGMPLTCEAGLLEALGQDLLAGDGQRVDFVVDHRDLELARLVAGRLQELLGLVGL